MPGPVLAASLRGGRARAHGRGFVRPHVYRPGETNPGRRTPTISPEESARQDTERRKRQRRTRERKEEERRRRAATAATARARAKWWRKVKQGVTAWATGSTALRRVAVADANADAATRAAAHCASSPGHRAAASCARAEARIVDGALPPIAVVVSVEAVRYPSEDDLDDESHGELGAASVLPASDAPGVDLATWREVRRDIARDARALPVAAVAADTRVLPIGIAAPRDARAALVCQNFGFGVALAGQVAVDSEQS